MPPCGCEPHLPHEPRQALGSPAVSDRSQTQPAVTVNPEAGEHRVVADPELLAACERAIEVTYERHPYYAARYSERGRRFSSSDSGWLARLGTADPDHAWGQVSWLAQVLAARGMPTVLLEEHLALLADQIRTVEGEQVRADGLAGLSRRLRRARLGALDHDTFVELERDLEVRTAGESTQLPRAGLLVVSAVADELRGLEGVESSLLEWLADPEVFSPTWARAVRTTADRARAAASPVGVGQR